MFYIKVASFMTVGNTLNSGFNFFCSAEFKDTLNLSKSGVDTFECLKTTAITNLSGPPPCGGTPMAAVSWTESSTALVIRSISTELTCTQDEVFNFLVMLGIKSVDNNYQIPLFRSNTYIGCTPQRTPSNKETIKNTIITLHFS